MRRRRHVPWPLACPATTDTSQLLGGAEDYEWERGLPIQKPRGEGRRPHKYPRANACRLPPAAAAAAAANAPAAAISPHPAPPDLMTTAAESEPPPALPLAPLLGNLPPDLFQLEVLRQLGPKALASLAGAGRGCAAAVAATALMQWDKRAKMTPPRYLRFHLPPLCLKEACSHAARGGNQEVLEWLHNTGCPWNADTCALAAKGGHLAMLQWARKHGCPWDGWTCASPLRAGTWRC